MYRQKVTESFHLPHLEYSLEVPGSSSGNCNLFLPLISSVFLEGINTFNVSLMVFKVFGDWGKKKNSLQIIHN